MLAGGHDMRLRGAEGTHDGDNLLLHQGRKRDQLQVEGEIELEDEKRQQLCLFARWSSRNGSSYRGDEESQGDGLLSTSHGCRLYAWLRVSRVLLQFRLERLAMLLMSDSP
jgi:hypothetical protein